MQVIFIYKMKENLKKKKELKELKKRNYLYKILNYIHK